jgi:hypothetical protein
MAKAKRSSTKRNAELKEWTEAVAQYQRHPCPPGSVRVALGHARAGWVQMAILCATWQQSVVISCSDVYNPFGSLKWFLNQLIDNNSYFS